MTNIDRKNSDKLRKVHLKTASGVMTRCYKSSPSPGAADDFPEACSPLQKVSQGSSQASGAEEASGGKEPAFGFLPELTDFPDPFSIGENSLLYLQPDFSTYNFWLSEPRGNLTHGVDLSDTFSCGGLVGTVDDVSALEPVLNAQGPDDLQNCATKPDPHSQNSINSSRIHEEINYRERCWNFPLELEEDIFECTTYWNLMTEVNERDLIGEKMVEDYLVDSSPQSSNVVTEVENLESNVLVYAPNRYLEEDARTFQSSPADLGIQNSDVRRERNRDSDKVSVHRTGRLPESWTEDGQSITIEGRSSATASCMIEDSDVEDRTVNKLMNEIGEKAHVLLRMNHYVNHRRKRFSAPGRKESRFLEPTTRASSSDKRNPIKGNRESLKLLGGLSRSPIRKSNTTLRLLNPGCSNSSGGESDGQNCHKSPPGATPGPLLVPLDSGIVMSLGGCASPLSNPISLKEMPNQSSNRGAPTLRLSSNACILRKKRTRYLDTCDGPATSNIKTRLDTESRSHDSPKNCNFSKTGTPRVSPAVAQFRRSPWDNRKKVRTCRRRPQCSPKSAKKLHFYSKIIQDDPCQVEQSLGQSTHSPEQREVSLQASKSTVRPGRRRVPLPQASVEILQAWLHENLSDPYPSRREKEDLLFETGLKMSQIDNWLGNARQKLKFKSRAVKDICNESSSSPRKRSKRKRSYPLTMQM